MELLRPGLSGQKEMVVEEQHLASVMGNVGVEVLSTHCVVLLMELASRNAVESLLEKARWWWAHGSAFDTLPLFQKDSR